MKASTIGLILLTLMVTTKYYISLNTMTHKDGSLRGGLVLDYSVIQKALFTPAYAQTPSLLAFNPGNLQADQPNTEHASQEKRDRVNTIQNNTATDLIVTEAVLEGPAPLEFANTLVVYNPSNPAISQMTTQYLDPEDSEPLDQGNTLVNEMQMMMPRR